MEQRFTVDTLLDESTYKEFQRSFTQANPLTVWCRILLALVAIYYICHFENPILWFVFFLFPLPLLSVHLLQNRKGGSSQYRRMLLSNNGNPNHSLYQFLDDRIVDTNLDNGNTVSYPYDQIRYLIHGPRLILVVLNYRLCLILSKDGIAGGTAEELIQFLLDHCLRCRKKVRKTTFGLWVNRVLAGILAAGCVWALLNIPGFSLLEHISGRLTNKMSYQDMAETMEPLGIFITSQTLEEMEEYDAQYLQEYGRTYYQDNPTKKKIQDLLYWEGCGIYNDETGEWTPSASGIYWMDMEIWNPETAYTDFLRGLDAMSDGILLSDIQENFSRVDQESGSGVIQVSFRMNNLLYAQEVWNIHDWFDQELVVLMGSILEADQDQRDLYVSYDGGQGLYFFYSDEETVRQLCRLTGLTFRKASQIYSFY